MTYEEYNAAIDQLIEQIKSSGKTYNGGVYGIPRGGYYPAIRIAKALGVPVIAHYGYFDKDVLVVDDIVETGSTIFKYGDNDTAAVFAYDSSPIKPTYAGVMMYEKKWLTFPDEGSATIEDNIVRILEYIGENPKREGLAGTPDRIKRMFNEIYRGYDPKRKPKITTFQNGKDGIVYDNMVIDEGDFYSCCEHHMMPFFGHYWFAYIPNPHGKILGISKIGRVVDYCAARLQIQERLVHDIVDMLADALGTQYPPLGIALLMKGEHLCKTMRGAKKKGLMTSSYLTGIFKTEPAVRAEFMQIVNK